MSDVVLRVDGLSKRYRLGYAEHFPPLTDRLEALVGTALRALGVGNGDQSISVPKDGSRPENIWALKDVSFTVDRGEAVGLIGGNGAGKSTLLKVLSRITEPTAGRAAISGRVGSLLEVGTGFHPELSGRENIYLNGALMGMRRAEIRRKLDAIVAFAEIDQFLDTPVKRYSSGMYVRLAFAVAAHLDFEILLVDEVLAVGDAAFQKKCLGKMGDVASDGRTVVFVSHNMDAVRRLCQRAILLDKGSIVDSGETSRCISRYLLRGVSSDSQVSFEPPHNMANGMPLVLHSVRILDRSGEPTSSFSTRSSIHLEIEWEARDRLYKPRIGFVLQTSDGVDVLTALDAQSWRDEWLAPGRRVAARIIPGHLLNEGEYVVDIGADSPTIDHRHPFSRSRTGAILRFEIEDDMTMPGKYYGEEGFRDSRWPGVLLMNLPWNQRLVPQPA